MIEDVASRLQEKAADLARKGDPETADDITTMLVAVAERTLQLAEAKDEIDKLKKPKP